MLLLLFFIYYFYQFQYSVTVNKHFQFSVYFIIYYFNRDVCSIRKHIFCKCWNTSISINNCDPCHFKLVFVFANVVKCGFRRIHSAIRIICRLMKAGCCLKMWKENWYYRNYRWTMKIWWVFFSFTEVYHFGGVIMF